MSKNFDIFKNFNENRDNRERRRGPDIIIRSLFWLNLISWLMVVVTAVFIFKAQPQSVNFFSRVLNAGVRTSWDTDLLTAGFESALILLLISVISIIVSRVRGRRKTDKRNVFSLVTLSMSFLAIITYIIII